MYRSLSILYAYQVIDRIDSTCTFVNFAMKILNIAQLIKSLNINTAN